MDIGLPKLDGIMATQQIKAVQPEVRVFMNQK
jgi:DNA-binding NarL/FixJ family response regulator